MDEPDLFSCKFDFQLTHKRKNYRQLCVSLFRFMKNLANLKILLVLTISSCREASLILGLQRKILIGNAESPLMSGEGKMEESDRSSSTTSPSNNATGSEAMRSRSFSDTFDQVTSTLAPEFRGKHSPPSEQHDDSVSPPRPSLPPQTSKAQPPPTTHKGSASPPPQHSNESRPPPESGSSGSKSKDSSDSTQDNNSPPPPSSVYDSFGNSISQFVSPSENGKVSPTSYEAQASNSGSSDSSESRSTVIGLSVAGSVFVMILAIGLAFYLFKRIKRRNEQYDGNGSGKQQTTPNMSRLSSSTGVGVTPDSVLCSLKTVFSYEEVMEFTDGFSLKHVIGEGGFGRVFKGLLPDGRLVAVKQLKAGSSQGEREFRAEVEIITRVHHRHLVSLVGYCICEQHRLLLYEFVPNKTLEHHLHGQEVSVLDWGKRLKIAIGSAKGLAYLHEDCHPKIIHRDIKSANILLDKDFEAQVADFGLAKLNDTKQTHVSTRIMGTYGYLAPEYATSGKLSDRSDVFSFGVVLLELITGRRALDKNHDEECLVEWARQRLIEASESGDVSELIDPRLEKHYVESELFRMIKMAALCIRHSAPNRPRMVQVVRALDADTLEICSGMKIGESTAYDSGKYSEEILNFRKGSYGFDDSLDYDLLSGDLSSKELGHSTSRSLSRNFK